MIKRIIKELKNHIPFTILATFIAITFVIILNKIDFTRPFEILHPLHVMASAIVTSAIFYKYKKNFIYALLIGITGAIAIGSISDIIFPYFGGTIFNLETSFHLPIIERPLIILASALIGGVTGIKTKLTKFPHLIHVSLSVFASLFYLLAFSQKITILSFILVFLIVFIAVIIPCCISDIIFPLLFIKNDKTNQR
jgi:hypothetical protein